MNPQYKRDFIRAGALAKEVRAFGRSLIQPGVSYHEVIRQVSQKIVDLGARAAFPPQIALDNVAAHYLPMPDEEIIFNAQVVKLDIGVCYNGAIGDCAVTVDLSGKHQVLVDAAEAALLAAEKIIRVGLPIREIGIIIEETMTAHGVKPVKNLCGHGLGKYQIHTAPSIPNCDNGSKATIKAGMTFAIEPFATDGKGMIYEEGAPMIFSFHSSGHVRTEIGRVLLTKIRTFQGLPFALADLISPETPLAKVLVGIKDLVKAEAIHAYGPLIEEGQGMVAQAENSILVDEDGAVLVTTR